MCLNVCEGECEELWQSDKTSLKKMEHVCPVRIALNTQPTQTPEQVEEQAGGKKKKKKEDKETREKEVGMVWTWLELLIHLRQAQTHTLKLWRIKWLFLEFSLNI